ncbi:MAG: cytidine deaminase [Tissierellia bacterium]|nr:cytidine deaminase [Tissierellia bacterium]
MLTKEKEKELMYLAIEASEKSYSPYSNFRVGAAILCDDGEIFTGTNVENASYGAGICAERSAAVKAVSTGNKKFKAVAIFGSPKDATKEELQYAFPCGICRQFLNEFADDMIVLVGKTIEDYQKFSFNDLLPESFGPKDLHMEEQ